MFVRLTSRPTEFFFLRVGLRRAKRESECGARDFDLFVATTRSVLVRIPDVGFMYG